MAFKEQYANKGYLASKKESTPGVAVTPNVYFPLYEEDFTTDIREDEDAPIVGIKHARYQMVQGQREHNGSFTVLAEPNTCGYLIDNIFTKASTSGSGPYTHTFGESTATDPKTYTYDFANGRHVHRYYGVSISEITPDKDDNKMLFKCQASALGAFHSAALAGTPTGTNPYTITLDTTYDPTPTKGLVVGDTMQIYDVSLDSYINFTIASIPTATTITTTTDVTAGASGDILTIKPATPSFSLLTPFQWARTEYRIADTAANALTAANYAAEEDTKGWTLTHNFEDEGGSHRSGTYDPAALLRTDSDVSVELNHFYDDPQEVQRFIAMTQRALVIRHFSESGYELRITVNDFRIAEGGKPSLKSTEYLYHEFVFKSNYKAADSQAMDIKVLNAVSSI